jgi:hypothetical protein
MWVDTCSPPLLFARHTFTPTSLQANVLVDSGGTPRIGGLGSAFIQSFPDVWSEDPEELTRCSAPECVNPEAFELHRVQSTKSSDVYAFGLLVYEVKRVFIPILERLTRATVVGLCR